LNSKQPNKSAPLTTRLLLVSWAFKTVIFCPELLAMKLLVLKFLVLELLELKLLVLGAPTLGRWRF
jgi:hypothetical protein